MEWQNKKDSQQNKERKAPAHHAIFSFFKISTAERLFHKINLLYFLSFFLFIFCHRISLFSREIFNLPQ